MSSCFDLHRPGGTYKPQHIRGISAQNNTTKETSMKGGADVEESKRGLKLGLTQIQTPPPFLLHRSHLKMSKLFKANSSSFTSLFSQDSVTITTSACRDETVRRNSSIFGNTERAFVNKTEGYRGIVVKICFENPVAQNAVGQHH